MVDQYNGKVRVVYKHFVVHPDTVMGAHVAACAAGKQGKFLEFTHAFWEQGFGEYAKTRDPSKLGEPTIMAIAGQLALDKGKIAAEMKGGECASKIQEDMKILNNFGVSGTPSFFINGKFTMFSDPRTFTAQIDEAIKEVEASGVPAAEYYQKVVMGQGLKTFRSKADAAKDG